MSGEMEPQDSRNVTGTSANQTGDRWSQNANNAQAGRPQGQQGQGHASQEQQQSNQGAAGQQAGEIRFEDQGAAGDLDVQFTGESGGGSGAGGQQSQVESGGSAQMGGICEHMEVIGADGVHLGTVDKLEGNRIKLTKADSGMGSHAGHHHYISCGLVAAVEGDRVRLSATAANAYAMEEEE